MKSSKQSQLKILTVCAALLAAALRAAHYAFGTDGRSLLVANHWSAIGLWVVSAAFGAALLFSVRGIKNVSDYSAVFPSSFVATCGCFALTAALALTCLRQDGSFQLPADGIVRILGLLSAAGLLVAGICRSQGKKASFFFHAFLCVFFTLRMIFQYRHWSADPQLQDYGFYLCAHTALMLTSYHHAAFAAGRGNLRAQWLWSLCAVYLCCAAIPHCSEALLMGCCALWSLTNLAVLPAPRRRIRPALRDEERTEE